MTIPTTLKIFGYTYKVILEDRRNKRGVDNPATAETRYHSIWIDTNQCQEERENSLLHEIIEEINYHLEFKLEHSTIMALGTVFYQILKDNNLCFRRVK